MALGREMHDDVRRVILEYPTHRAGIHDIGALKSVSRIGCYRLK